MTTTIDLHDGHRAPGSKSAHPFLFIDRSTGRIGTLAHFLDRGEVELVRREIPPETWTEAEYTACRLVQMCAGLDCLPWTLTPKIAARVAGAETLADARLACIGGSGDPSSDNVHDRLGGGGGYVRVLGLRGGAEVLS
jgi:hypothetical protein